MPALSCAGEEGDEWLGKPAPEFALTDLDGKAHVGDPGPKARG